MHVTRQELMDKMREARRRTGRRNLGRSFAAAWELRQWRNDHQPLDDDASAHKKRMLQNRLTLIPLGRTLAADTMRLASEEFPRRRNWDSPAADCSSTTPVVREWNHGRYSSRCTFTRWTYQPRIRSCGICTARYLQAYVADRSIRMVAPRGWQFGRDDNGLYIERSDNRLVERRYHFNSDDLVEFSQSRFCGIQRASITRLRKAALAHERRQIDQRKAALAKVRELRERDRERIKIESVKQTALDLGVWVSFADSVAAGNCPAGTKTWCDRHDLDPRRRYPLQVIERFCTDRLVSRVRDAAIERAARELIRGYCEV